MSASVRGAETAVSFSAVFFFFRQKIPIEDALNETVVLADQQFPVSLVDNTDNDMSFVIRVVIIRVDDPYRIQQSHPVFEAKRRTGIKLQNIFLIDPAAYSARNAAGFSRFKQYLYRRIKVVSGASGSSSLRKYDIFVLYRVCDS
jgi:hypothetical protein